MIFGSIFIVAFDALRANKLRSGLTLLGVMIGVTSVMTIISALEGMSNSVEDSLAKMGPATFVVQRMGIPTSEREFLEQIKRKPIDVDAIEIINESCDLVELTAPRTMSAATVKYQNKKLNNVFIASSSYRYLDIVDIRVEQGRFHSQEDDIYKRNVCYIGDLIRTEFFEGLDPIGKTIKINGVKFTVIGVSEKFGSSFGNNQDNFIIMPFSTFTKQFGKPRYNYSIFVKAKSVEVLDDAMDQVRAVMRAQRQVPFNKPDDFTLMTAESILEFLNSITFMIRSVLIGISSISLVVGGIVVMNIMMVSVTERTREIGIRKAIGAKNKHILIQFVFESLMLTFTGGLIGILTGYFIAEALMMKIDMQISPSMFAIFSGVIISSGTGLIFGIYPAMKAAKLDPIKALSYE